MAVEEELGTTNMDDEVGREDGNKIREGQVEQHMVEENDTSPGDVGEANRWKSNTIRLHQDQRG